MKRLIYIIALSILSCLTTPEVLAVTDKEMEEARTIATKAYLRYANDGSGYLDKIHPKTMADLERQLKPKEKENLKAFKAIPVPAGYASWDKQKLVEYWGVKAFATKGLVEKGRIGRNRAKKNIAAMQVAAPKNISAASQPEPSPADSKDPSPAPKSTATRQADTPSQSDPAAEADSSATDAIEQANATLDAIAALEDEPQIKKADNHTWIYIIILIILVAVVVALVVFASNVMKRNEISAGTTAAGKGKASDSDDTKALREKFAASLSSKNEEVRTLSKKIENLNTQNANLKLNFDKLTAEAASLRSRLAEANLKIKELQNALSATTAGGVSASQASPATSQPSAQVSPQAAASGNQQQSRPATALRTIYLGRANAKGIFVRADRSLNPGNSIYRLDTNDGYAGSFRVANDPTVWEMALLTPRESLSGACTIADIDNTDSMTRIVTDSAGTAIFEGGCWKMIRKAKVHYE